MKKFVYVTFGLMVLGFGLQSANAQDKPADKAAPAPRTLKVKLNYTGAGTVDEKHKIQVFMFDTPDFTQGNAMPTGMQMTAAKDGSVTFGDIASTPVYVVAVYDPSGGYDGQSGPPPTGSSLGMYTKEPPKPEPINIDAGKTAEVDLVFDDTAKMP